MSRMSIMDCGVVRPAPSPATRSMALQEEVDEGVRKAVLRRDVEQAIDAEIARREAARLAEAARWRRMGWGKRPPTSW